MFIISIVISKFQFKSFYLKSEAERNPQYLGYLFPTFRRWYGLPLISKLGIVFYLNNNNNILTFIYLHTKRSTIQDGRMGEGPNDQAERNEEPSD